MTIKEGSPIAYVIATVFATLEYIDRFSDVLAEWLSTYIDIATAVSITVAVILGILRIVDRYQDARKKRGDDVQP